MLKSKLHIEAIKKVKIKIDELLKKMIMHNIILYIFLMKF